MTTDPLPDSPMPMWDEEHSAGLWTWISGALSTLFGGGAVLRRGRVEVSKNGLKIEDRHRRVSIAPSPSLASRFLGWDQIEDVRPSASPDTLATIQCRDGEAITLGASHLPTGSQRAVVKDLRYRLLVDALEIAAPGSHKSDR